MEALCVQEWGNRVEREREREGGDKGGERLERERERESESEREKEIVYLVAVNCSRKRFQRWSGVEPKVDLTLSVILLRP